MKSTAVPDGRADVPARGDVLEAIGRLFGRPLGSEMDVLKLVNAGAPASTSVRIARELGFPTNYIASMQTKRRRLRHSPQRLSADETQQLVGIARVYGLACELFQDEHAARRWLHRPAQFLPGGGPITPSKLATYDSGVRLLEDRIVRTAHGMF